jgi:carbohydrate diacid regulator
MLVFLLTVCIINKYFVIIIMNEGELMKLDRLIAQRVIDSLSEVIDHNVNFIDRDGIIIASADKTRIGSFHAASMKVFKKGKKIIVNTDEEYEGSLPGVNMPVYFEGEIIGAIGITGSYDEISKFDEIIRSMTESLVYQSFLKTQNRMKSQLKQQVFKQLLMYPGTDMNTIVGKGKVVDLEIESLDQVIIARVKGLGVSEMFENQGVLENLYRSFKFSFKSYCRVETSLVDDFFVCMVNEVSPDALKRILKKVYKDVDDQRLCIGVGKKVSSFKRLHLSYHQAMQALNISLQSRDIRVAVYEEMDLEVLVQDLSRKAAEEYVQRVLGTLPEKDLLQAKGTLKAYFANNGSIAQTAEQLFIHKNTLQYRLNRILDKTGYNPRELEDGFNLYLALHLLDRLNK